MFFRLSAVTFWFSFALHFRVLFVGGLLVFCRHLQTEFNIGNYCKSFISKKRRIFLLLFIFNYRFDIPRQIVLLALNHGNFASSIFVFRQDTKKSVQS